MKPLPPSARRQRGISTLEALLAFALLSLALAALGRVYASLRAGADAAREHSEALRLAQREIEQLRAFATPAGWDAIADAEPAEVTPPGATTRYRRERAVLAHPELGLKTIRVTLRWVDRHGAEQAIVLQTLIGGADPTLAAALAVPRPAL